MEIIRAVGAHGHGKRRTVSVLDAIAQRWDVIGDSVYLEVLTQAIVDGQLQHDSDAVLIRRALGRILALQWRTDLDNERTPAARDTQWTSILETTTSGLETDDEGIVPGSHLIAVAMTLLQLPAGQPWTVQTLDALLAMRGRAAPFQLARGFFSVLLGSPSPAGEEATRALGRLLGALATSTENPVNDEPGMWAGIARRCLVHRDVPPYRVAAAVHASSIGTSASHWLDERLLLQLAPVAAAGGHPVALAALGRLVAEPTILSRRDQGILLDQCLERRGDCPSLDEITVVLTIACRRLPALASLADEDPCPPALLARRAVIARLIATYLDGDDQSQRDGAWVWRKLCRSGLLNDPPETIMSRIRTLRGPVPKAEAIGLLAEVTGPESPDRPAVLGLLRDMIQLDQWPLKGLTANSTSPQRPLVLDAVRDSWLQLLATEHMVTPDDWPIAHALACAPRLTGSRKVDLTGFRGAAAVLVRLAEGGDVDAAYRGLEDMIESLRTGGFDRKQLVNGSFWLRPAVRAVLRLGSDEQAVALLQQTETAPARAGILIVQVAAQQRFDVVRPYLVELQARRLPHGVVGAIDTVLRRRSRTIGSRTMPQILQPAS